MEKNVHLIIECKIKGEKPVILLADECKALPDNDDLINFVTGGFMLERGVKMHCTHMPDGTVIPNGAEVSARIVMTVDGVAQTIVEYSHDYTRSPQETTHSKSYSFISEFGNRTKSVFKGMTIHTFSWSAPENSKSMLS